MNIEKLYKKLNAQINFENYKHFWKELEIPTKTIILHEGEISKKIFYIEEGCLRIWYNNNGKDITFQFFFENEIVSSIESFTKQKPSLFYLESIEPSKLRYILKDDFDKIVSESPFVKDLLLEIILERQFYYIKYLLSFIKDKPQKRYLKLLEEKPYIIQRIPQHYIASYLGITSVSLSRIRNRRPK